MTNRSRRVLVLVAFTTVASIPAAVYAQRSKSGVQQPTSKAGKCAKANGGVYDAQRNGWYTLDLLNYRKCMSSP